MKKKFLIIILLGIIVCGCESKTDPKENLKFNKPEIKEAETANEKEKFTSCHKGLNINIKDKDNPYQIFHWSESWGFSFNNIHNTTEMIFVNCIIAMDFNTDELAKKYLEEQAQNEYDSIFGSLEPYAYKKDIWQDENVIYFYLDFKAPNIIDIYNSFIEDTDFTCTTIDK